MYVCIYPSVCYFLVLCRLTTLVYVCMYVCIYPSVCYFLVLCRLTTLVYVCMYVCIYPSVCYFLVRCRLTTLVYVCMYVCMYVCVYTPVFVLSACYKDGACYPLFVRFDAIEGSCMCYSSTGHGCTMNAAVNE